MNRWRKARWILAGAMCFALGLLGRSAAQSPQVQTAPKPASPRPQQPPEKPIRVDVDIVLVPVTVMDPYGRLVTGLEKEDFRIFENGVEQEVLYLSTAEVPISAGVIYDRSGSMGGYLNLANQSALTFFRTANPQDEFFLIVFNNRSEQVSDFTSEYDKLQMRLLQTEAKGRTALVDAMYWGLNKMKQARHPRRVLVVITDGMDNASRYSEKDLESILRESDTQLYILGGANPIMHRLVESSGGRMFGMGASAQYGHDDTTERIWTELRMQYILAYSPKLKARDGKWRKLQVKTRPIRGFPPMQIFAKRGYYAPGQ